MIGKLSNLHTQHRETLLTASVAQISPKSPNDSGFCFGVGANTKGHFSGSVGPCSHCGGIKWSVMLPVTVPAQHESGNKTSKPATGVIWIKTPCLFTKLVPLSYFLGKSERMCGAWNKAADRAQLNTSGKNLLHTSGLWDFKIKYLMSVFVVKLHEVNLHWRNID